MTERKPLSDAGLKGLLDLLDPSTNVSGRTEFMLEGIKGNWEWFDEVQNLGFATLRVEADGKGGGAVYAETTPSGIAFIEQVIRAGYNPYLRVELPEGWTTNEPGLYVVPTNEHWPEDIWQASNGEWAIDVGGERGPATGYVCRVIQNYDWDNPVDEQEIKRAEDVVKWIERHAKEHT